VSRLSEEYSPQIPILSIISEALFVKPGEFIRGFVGIA